jgi:uncharacterized protein YqgV (UPF0045/DUF77 family)
MMDNETLQTLIRHFVELKCAVNTGHSEVKSEISAVTAGQELKNDVKSAISALETNVKGDISALETNVEGDISALETKINAGHEELRQEISVFQERIRNIETGQAEFEERVTRNLREDLSRNI